MLDIGVLNKRGLDGDIGIRLCKKVLDKEPFKELSAIADQAVFSFDATVESEFNLMLLRDSKQQFCFSCYQYKQNKGGMQQFFQYFRGLYANLYNIFMYRNGF